MIAPGISDISLYSTFFVSTNLTRTAVEGVEAVVGTKSNKALGFKMPFFFGIFVYCIHKMKVTISFNRSFASATNGIQANILEYFSFTS